MYIVRSITHFEAIGDAGGGRGRARMLRSRVQVQVHAHVVVSAAAIVKPFALAMAFTDERQTAKTLLPNASIHPASKVPLCGAEMSRLSLSGDVPRTRHIAPSIKHRCSHPHARALSSAQ